MINFKARLKTYLMIPYLIISVLLINLTSATTTSELPLTKIFDWSAATPVITLTPTTTAKLVQIVQQAALDDQKIAIKGAGRSTGGQVAAPNTIQIDTCQLNRIIEINPQASTITVEPGITWGQIQHVIDPLGLALIVMQSYADFSVGGSLSVNVHGQDQTGTLNKTVESFQLLQHDGTIVTCSRTENTQLFNCVLGGYGLFGIITQVTLKLKPNCAVMRESMIQPIPLAFDQFMQLLQQPDIELFSSRLDSDPASLYQRTFTIIYRKKLSVIPIAPLTDPSRTKLKLERKFFDLLRTTNAIKKIRFPLGKLYFERTGTISSRNNVMHANTTTLKWHSSKSRDILQEYFIPVAHCPQFIKQARKILKKYRVNVLNTTIRFVPADPETVLSYARENCFAFVLFVHIENNSRSYQTTQNWSRELIDCALAMNGSFYLPYQTLATKAQLLRAYPRWPELLALKQQFDPQARFINSLYLNYK